jgi:hypothetical protein
MKPVKFLMIICSFAIISGCAGNNVVTLMKASKEKNPIIPTKITVNNLLIRIQWFWGRAFFLGIALAGLLLSSCAVPIAYGPFYQPTYPEKSKYVWTPRDIEGAGPPASIRMRFGACFMELRAEADEKNFTLIWSQEELGDKCRIKVSGRSFELHDLDTDSRRVISTFRRVFLSFGPGLDIHQRVDLASLSPGFAAVPSSERRYTLALFVERVFKGSLPDSTRIQLPDIVIGDRVITLPPLHLERHNKVLESRDDYVPNVGQKVADSTSLSEFGEFNSSTVVWHEEDSLLRLAASFSGTPYSEEDLLKKRKDESEIFGHIYVEVIGDLSFRLTDEQVAWHVPGDTQDYHIPENHSKWYLKMYTTADISDRLGHLAHLSWPDTTFDDKRRKFVVVIPGYRPERFSITLPKVTANDHEWPLQPILFEYKSGGVGVWTMY